MIMHALQTVLHLYKKTFRIGYIVNVVIVHQTNVSYTKPSKHV